MQALVAVSVMVGREGHCAAAHAATPLCPSTKCDSRDGAFMRLDSSAKLACRH